MSEERNTPAKDIYAAGNIAKTILLSAFGLFMFFVNVPIGGKSTTLISHAVNYMVTHFSMATYVICMVCLVIGVVRPFVKGIWKRNGFSCFFAFCGILAIPNAIMDIFKIAPQSLVDSGLLDLMFRNIIPQMIWVIVFSAVIITFILNYGFMEFVAVYARPFMKRLFHLPGLTAVNAVSCFMGNYSVGAMIANKLYLDRKLTKRETVLLLTGFGTVAVSYMMVQAKMAAMDDHFNLIFFGALAVTILTSLVQCRLWPVTKVPNEYVDGSTTPVEEEVVAHRTKYAVETALTTSANAPQLLTAIKNSFISACRMLFTIIPMATSIALIMLYILECTPYLDFISYIFLPIATLFQMPEPMVVSKALSVALFDTAVPCAIVSGLPIYARFAVTVASISEIVHFCGTIPVFLSVDTGFSAVKYMAVALERVIISFIFASVLGLVLL